MENKENSNNPSRTNTDDMIPPLGDRRVTFQQQQDGITPNQNIPQQPQKFLTINFLNRRFDFNNFSEIVSWLKRLSDNDLSTYERSLQGDQSIGAFLMLLSIAIARHTRGPNNNL